MNNSYGEFFKAAKKAQQEKVKKRPESLLAKNKGESVQPKSKKNIKIKAKARKKAELPVSTLVLTFVGLVFAGIGFAFPEYYDELFSKVSIKWISQSIAETKSAEKKTEAKGESKEKVASDKSSATSEEMPKTKKWTQEEVSHFNKLSDRKVQLDQREAELNDLERELHKQKKSIEESIKKLEELRVQISNVLKEKVEVDEGKVGRLVEFYSNMKPQQAAKVIDTLNEDLAVEILGKMKKKNAAEILNLLKPEKAQNLTEKFAGYKRR